MIIAVNAVAPAFNQVLATFLQQAFLTIAAQSPNHQFVFIGFKPIKKTSQSNCSFFHNGLTVTSTLRFNYFLNYQLPSLLRKTKANVLVNYNCCSMRCSLPQVLYCNLAAFVTHSEFYKKNWLNFYRNNTNKFLQKATTIVTTSHFLQTELQKQLNVSTQKNKLVYEAPASFFKPFAHWNQKESIKNRVTSGKEYFLYSGVLNKQQNLINLLKAFTFFKQRQKSNMMLVLADTTNADVDFIKSLHAYKYKVDVVLAENLLPEELAEITAAAYAQVHVPIYDATGVNVMQALQCHTPVIAANNTALIEICGEAAVFCNADDYNDIAAKMMLLFTNEDRRNLIIAKSREQANKFNETEQVATLWQTVLQLSLNQ
jgi:glycosyltransferase involved in cell wall biosynthesis